jgi:RHS repeat-associated protein
VVARQWYYPYGSVRASTGTLPTKRTYTGQIADDTGLYFYNARYYASGLGRFASADSIVPGAGEPQAFNRYAFVFNNPLKYTDPSGHDPHYCETAECEKRYLDTLSRIQRKQEWWRQLLQSAEDAISNLLMPMMGGPVVAPQPAPVPLQLRAIATPTGAPSTVTPPAPATLQTQVQANATTIATTTKTATPSPVASSDRVPLYRAVDQTELSVILATGTYGYAPSGGGKYFAYTYAGVVKFATSNFNRDRTMTITQIDVSRETLALGYDFVDIGGAGPSVHFSDSVLPALYVDMSPIVILDSP